MQAYRIFGHLGAYAVEHNERRRFEDEELSLSDIFVAIKKHKRMVMFFTGATALLGLIYAVFSTPVYETTVTIQPVTESGGSLGAVAQSFAPAAALAGVNLNGGNVDKEEYLAILRSRQLAERFIERYQVKSHLFASQWDSEKATWKRENPSFLGRISLAVSRMLAKLSNDAGWREDQAAEPSNWNAYKEFSKIRVISEDTQTGIVTVTFQFYDPHLVTEWANEYVALANEQIRSQQVNEAKRALAYLNGQVEMTSVSGLRETIFRLIEGQLELVMQANARPEFAFKIIDKAGVPEDRSHPKRGLIIMVSVFAGLFLGIFIALMRNFLRPEQVS